MTTLPTLSNFHTAPDLSDVATLKQRLTDTVNDIVAFVPQMQSLVTAQNTLIGELQTIANSNEVSSNLAQQSALNAQASANFQGVWASKGYTLGQCVLGSNNVFYVCTVTHTVAQNPTSTSGYWVVNVPLGAIGNINSPLLDMPLKNSLAMKAGVGSATFTRASTATYIDRYGVLKSAAVDEPRFEKEGYLNEGASTNLHFYSETINSTNYTATQCTLTQNTTETLDPYGTNVSTKVTATATGFTYFYRLGQPISGTSYTQSYYVKAGTENLVKILLHNNSFGVDKNVVFNLTTGTIQSTTSDTTSSILAVGNGWYRISATATATTSTFGFMSILAWEGSSNIGEYFYVFGAQLEALPFASSYIPTVASAVTRSADNLNATLIGNTPLGWNDKTIIIDFTYYGTTATKGQGLFSFDDINYNILRVEANSNNLVLYYHSDALFSTPLVVGNSYRAAYVVSGNSKTSNTVKLYLNGVLIGTQSGVAPVGIQSITSNMIISIGRFAVDSIKIKVSNFRIYDKALTAQEVALA